MPEKPTLPPVPQTVKGMAEYYCTNERNILRYRAKAAPVSNPIEFREWINQQASAPEGLLKRLDELLGPLDVSPLGETGNDWAEFEAQARSADPKDAMAKVSKARDFCFFRWEHAARTRNKKEEKFYGDMLAKMEGVLHDAQLRAKKLGLESGDLVPRSVLEKVAFHLSWNLLRCADTVLASLAKQITERDPSRPPITAEEVRAIGEPLLLTAIVYQPITRAMAGDNGAAPPAWLVAALKDGLEEVVEPAA